MLADGALSASLFQPKLLSRLFNNTSPHPVAGKAGALPEHTVPGAAGDLGSLFCDLVAQGPLSFEATAPWRVSEVAPTLCAGRTVGTLPF